jgi:hypothetical protein
LPSRDTKRPPACRRLSGYLDVIHEDPTGPTQQQRVVASFSRLTAEIPSGAADTEGDQVSLSLRVKNSGQGAPTQLSISRRQREIPQIGDGGSRPRRANHCTTLCLPRPHSAAAACHMRHRSKRQGSPVTRREGRAAAAALFRSSKEVMTDLDSSHPPGNKILLF